MAQLLGCMTDDRVVTGSNQCLLQETLKVVGPFYNNYGVLPSMAGEEKDPHKG